MRRNLHDPRLRLRRRPKRQSPVGDRRRRREHEPAPFASPKAETAQQAGFFDAEITPATRKVLQLTGLSLAQMDVIDPLHRARGRHAPCTM